MRGGGTHVHVCMYQDKNKRLKHIRKTLEIL